MNSKKLSSSKELRVIIPAGDSQSPTVVGGITMRVHKLYDTSVASILYKVKSIFRKTSKKVELIVLPNIHNNPLEDMMNRIAVEIDTLPDESIIIIARGLHMVFGKGKEHDRKTKLDYINSVIMPFIGENEKLPTILISDTDTVIKKFGIIIKEKVGPIMKRKVARLK